MHRPRYRDITLPKGKQHRNEPLPLTAVREVAEETGCRIRLGVPLQPVEYSIRKVGPKVVSWWIGEALEEQGHSPDDEVDEVLWLPVDRADDLLTYPSELQVLEEALSVPLPTTTIVVVRHDDGLMTVYAGVDKLSVAKGDTVKRGQSIGAARNSGVVHFEVRQGFDSVDPEDYL